MEWSLPPVKLSSHCGDYARGIDDDEKKFMIPPAAHKSSWETSEAIFGIPLLASIILSVALRWPIASSIIRWLCLVFGILFFVLGVYLIIAARRELARFGQPTDPGRPTHQIVVSGVFSISRNPLYLGVVFVIAGLALIMNSWWIFIFLIFEVILCHIVLILPEERYLTTLFGTQYQAYRQSVHRWLGRK